MKDSAKTIENNKRLYKNTAFLYMRMLLSMVVSLYTSRIILQTLGVIDYGICNVVGGVVAMFSFLKSTMSGAASRYLTFELGAQNHEKLIMTFSSAFWVHVFLGAVFFLLTEFIGVPFLVYKLNIPESRMFAAHIVFQLSVISAIITVIQVPYNACLIAHEKFDVYAYVELANTFLKLGILFLLLLLDFDKLILYATFIFIISVGTVLFYIFYCIKKYKECREITHWNKDIIKSMLSYSGWDLFGNMGVTARTQGVNMLLNIFFGPAANAAAAIATSVQTSVAAFAQNINTAIRPQIIKYYAQGSYREMSSLVNTGCRFNMFILLFLMIPLIAEIDYVLKLWLGVVPDGAPAFCIYTMIFSLFSNMAIIVHTGNHASGNIKKPSFINGSLYISIIPISYLLFELGSSSWVPFLLADIAIFIVMFSNAIILHENCEEYRVIDFINDVILKSLIVVIPTSISIIVLHNYLEPSFLRLLLSCGVSSIVLLITGYRVMIPEYIRQKLISTIKSKYNNIHKSMKSISNSKECSNSGTC